MTATKKKTAVPSKKSPEPKSLDRVYDKRCDAGKLEAELIEMGLAKGVDFHGVSVDMGKPNTIVHCCKPPNSAKAKKINNAVAVHSAG